MQKVYIFFSHFVMEFCSRSRLNLRQAARSTAFFVIVVTVEQWQACLSLIKTELGLSLGHMERGMAPGAFCTSFAELRVL